MVWEHERPLLVYYFEHDTYVVRVYHPDDSTTLTCGKTVEELADQPLLRKAVAEGIKAKQNRPIKSAAMFLEQMGIEYRGLTPEEERVFLEKLGLRHEKKPEKENVQLQSAE
ncbi:hypothetical protein JW707_02745 [Candidatus Woesearchaeota archaeon]|nr:hypothetical protein [Candidatus Woesearchaeota archaeon]